MKSLINMLLLGVITLLSACGNSVSEPVQAASVAAEAVIASPHEVEESTRTIQCNGRVEIPPMYRADIHSRISGYVEETKLLKGQSVKKGQVLAILTSQELIEIQSLYLQSIAQLTSLKRDFERKESLLDTDATSEREFLTSKANYETELARSKSLRIQIEYLGINIEDVESKGPFQTLQITSPITGFVHETFANNGMRVQAEDKLFTILDDQHKHVELEVFSEHAGQLKIGQKVEFNPVGSQESHIGYVFLINKAMDDQTQTLHLHVHPTSSNEGLIIGSYVDAVIYLDEFENNESKHDDELAH